MFTGCNTFLSDWLWLIYYFNDIFEVQILTILMDDIKLYYATYIVISLVSYLHDDDVLVI